MLLFWRNTCCVNAQHMSCAPKHRHCGSYSYSNKQAFGQTSTSGSGGYKTLAPKCRQPALSTPTLEPANCQQTCRVKQPNARSSKQPANLQGQPSHSCQAHACRSRALEGPLELGRRGNSSQCQEVGFVQRSTSRIAHAAFDFDDRVAANPWSLLPTLSWADPA